ncbi:hypothetical protein MNBD_NITROSPINAE02-217 [hydrothermal vent metagenome]|uniref:Uncharacterized protein n=1 Tax=hydrothermal vent metagenome TaxID=652676 RepID=A0A3B1CLD9_9ZZZZ
MSYALSAMIVLTIFFAGWLARDAKKLLIIKSQTGTHKFSEGVKV